MSDAVDLVDSVRVPDYLRRVEFKARRGGYTRGWQVVFPRPGKSPVTKLFSDLMYSSSEAAKAAAEKWRDEHLAGVIPDSPRLLLREIERLRHDNQEMLEELLELRGPKCTHCGCTEAFGCDGGCNWVEVDYERGQGVCSACAPAPKRRRTRKEAAIGDVRR